MFESKYVPVRWHKGNSIVSLAEFRKREKSKEADQEKHDDVGGNVMKHDAAEELPTAIILTEEEELLTNPPSSPKDDMDENVTPGTTSAITPTEHGPAHGVVEIEDEVPCDEVGNPSETGEANANSSTGLADPPPYLTNCDVSENVQSSASKKMHSGVHKEVGCASAAESSPCPSKPKKQSGDVTSLFDTLHGGLMKGKE